MRFDTHDLRRGLYSYAASRRMITAAGENFFRPFGADSEFALIPTTYVVGSILMPVRGG